jgi:hypothetical protein
MRTFPPALFLVMAGLATAQTVPVTPTTPTHFDIKPVTGPTSSAGATITPGSTAPLLKQTTYLTLSAERAWTNPAGKTLTGKLIAWEQTTATTTDTPAPVADKPITSTPTVLKNGKVRLLIDRKAFEIPLDQLDPASQKLIQDLNARLHPAAAPAKP